MPRDPAAMPPGAEDGRGVSPAAAAAGRGAALVALPGRFEREELS